MPRTRADNEKPSKLKENSYGRIWKGLFAERQVLRRKNGQSVFTWEKVYERNEPLDMRNYARAAYKYFRWKFDEIEKSLRGEDIDPPQTQAQRERKKSRRVISRGIRV